MTPLATLVRHSLRRRRWLLLAEGVLLCLFQVFAAAAAGDVHDSNGFAAFALILPSFMREWVSVMMSSFASLSLVGFSHPIVLLLLVGTAINIATEPVDEAESRFVDVVMARPVPRGTPIDRSMIVIVVAALVGIASLALGTWIGMTTMRPADAQAPSVRTVASLATGLGMVVLAWGGITLAIAAMSVRRASAGAIAGVLTAAMFILALLGDFWTAARPLAHISPFWYHRASTLVAGGSMNWSNVAILAAITMLAYITARITYTQRDL